mmetsp:Transcript_102888/g.290658  ORF Transcript_102888/g.290658 Transcript_102888/m.290658 type:complete len:306 (+) Transcript_102888:459-1376(+)
MPEVHLDPRCRGRQSLRAFGKHRPEVIAQQHFAGVLLQGARRLQNEGNGHLHFLQAKVGHRRRCELTFQAVHHLRRQVSLPDHSLQLAHRRERLAQPLERAELNGNLGPHELLSQVLLELLEVEVQIATHPICHATRAQEAHQLLTVIANHVVLPEKPRGDLPAWVTPRGADNLHELVVSLDQPLGEGQWANALVAGVGDAPNHLGVSRQLDFFEILSELHALEALDVRPSDPPRALELRVGAIPSATIGGWKPAEELANLHGPSVRAGDPATEMVHDQRMPLEDTCKHTQSAQHGEQRLLQDGA